MRRFLAVSLGLAVLFGIVPPMEASGPARPWTVFLPPPSGSGRVGTFWLRFLDSSRSDRDGPVRGPREILVRFWYPAAPTGTCERAPYTSPRVWSYLSRISGLRLPNIATNSCRQAQVATGLHPVVLFTPGYTGMLTDETFLFEDLASRGYVVASVAHPYETVAVEFPDGRLVTSLVGSYLGGGSLQADEQSVRSARAVRLADLKFLLGEVQRLSATADSPFSGKLDLSRIGAMGHSLGGDVALVSLQRDVRLRAGVWIDGLISEELAQGTSKPVLLLAAGREQWSGDECQLWDRLRGPRTAINLLGAEHLTLSDAAWLTQSVPQLAVAGGSLGREQTLAAVREYVAAFFDQSLRGRSAGTLATGRPSAAVRVTRQDESLCSIAVGLQ